MFTPDPNAVTAEEVSRPNVPAATAMEAVDAVMSGTPLRSSSSGIPIGRVGSRTSRSAGAGSGRVGSGTLSGSEEKEKDEVVYVDV